MPQTFSPPKRSRWKTLLLYLHTLRYLRPGQIVHRFLFEIRFFLYRRYPLFCEKAYALPAESAFERPPLTDAIFLKGLQEASPCPRFEDQEEILTRSGRLLRNEFVFLNHPHRFEGRVDWRCPSVSRGWSSLVSTSMMNACSSPASRRNRVLDSEQSPQK